MQLPAHGSNTKYVYESMHLEQPAETTDFSVNLNPLGAPQGLKAQWAEWFHVINDYPDPQAQVLTDEIAHQEKIPADHLLLGNGAAEMITLLARHLRGKKVIIVHPAFSEYETACKNESCEIVHITLEAPDWELELTKMEKELETASAVFLCNPNNPTGVHYDNKAVEELIQLCIATDTLCIIDEAFYDFLPEPVTYIQNMLKTRQLLILRSLTKMYSIAGLRLGFLAGNPAILKEIGKTQPHWSVNALAMKAGVTCLEDTAHVSHTQQYVEQERDKIFKQLKQLGYEHSPSKINFYLLKDPSLTRQEDLFICLLKKGIVLRHTENFPGIEGKWLRVAIKTETENAKLMEALAAWKQES